MLNIYKKYLDETLDADGNVESFTLHCPDDFNFAYDVVDLLGTETPDRRAMRWTDDRGAKVDLTFADFKEGSDRAASYFQRLGIGKGDRVMLILRRHYQFWFAILGLHKIGAIAIPATFQLRSSDIVYRLRTADVSAVICTGEGEISDHVDQAVQQYEKPVKRIMVLGSKKGWQDFDLGLISAPPFVKPEEAALAKAADIMLLYFTSGTEGQPKMVTHNFTYPIAHIPTAKYWQKVDPNGLHFTVSDTGWAKSVWGKIYGQWLMEAGIYVYDFLFFNPARMLEHMAEDNVTTFCAPPTTYRYLLQEGFNNYNLSSLQHLTTAGEALPPEVFNDCLRQTGLEMKEGFGQTETVLSCATYYWVKAKPGSMGKPTGTYPVVLLDGEGNECEPGVAGEICIRADRGADQPIGLYLGYTNADELTDSVWYDGYYHTHDEAIVDEEGYYWYVGRLDDMIKTSGFRVGPFEVESVILGHPAVLEVAVTGVPDAHRGQAIKATCILRPGYEPSRELAVDIKKYARARISAYKSPRIVEFADELPKTISGKVRRSEIRSNDGANGAGDANDAGDAASNEDDK